MLPILEFISEDFLGFRLVRHGTHTVEGVAPILEFNLDGSRRRIDGFQSRTVRLDCQLIECSFL